MTSNSFLIKTKLIVFTIFFQIQIANDNKAP